MLKTHYSLLTTASYYYCKAAVVLGDFDFAANPTIYLTIFILSAFDLITLLLGFWRERRRRFTRLREGRSHEEEGQVTSPSQ